MVAAQLFQAMIASARPALLFASLAFLHWQWSGGQSAGVRACFTTLLGRGGVGLLGGRGAPLFFKLDPAGSSIFAAATM